MVTGGAKIGLRGFALNLVVRTEKPPAGVPALLRRSGGIGRWGFALNLVVGIEKQPARCPSKLWVNRRYQEGAAD